MKNLIKYKLLMLILMFTVGCKDQLDVVNPNEPELPTLDTESGLKRASLGVYGGIVTPEGDYEGGLLSFNFSWYTLTNHEVMGDAVFVPWGNFSWRWLNQVAEITLDNGTKVLPPAGGTQSQEINIRNTRQVGDDNPTKHEWYACYNIINTCNVILAKLDEGKVTFKGDAESKVKTLRAWCHFWKGYGYSRIGSMYSAGVILDQAEALNSTFVTNSFNSNFVTNVEIIKQANDDYDRAIAILPTISGLEAYEEILMNAIPELGKNKTTVPSVEEWARNIYSLKARNILVNKKRKDMTAADWQTVLEFSEKGLQPADFNFIIKQDNTTIETTLLSHRVLIGWAFPSERLIQEYKPEDKRLVKYFRKLPAPQVNMAGRGIHLGTRWAFVSGTDVASTEKDIAQTFIGSSFEENELMKAEANIALGNIEVGLSQIDNVRQYQKSELPLLAGAGLDAASAFEELRRERRVSLLLRGVSFYDARRWGIIDPVADGGGRKGAVVLDAQGNVNTNATIDYRYLNYFGVPANEIDFNTPSAGSADVSPR